MNNKFIVSNPADMEIGQALKDMRIKCRLSRTEVARQGGFPGGVAVDRIENGIEPILYRDVMKLLAIYRGNAADLPH